MEKICKKLSWVSLGSLLAIVVGMIFGILAINSLPIDETDQTVKTIITIILIIVTVVSIISGIISFFGIRKGEIKTAILGMGRNSVIQLLGPIAAFGLAVAGFVKAEKTDSGAFIFLVVSFVIAVFCSGLIIKALKGYRKDKETHTYTAIVGYVASFSLLLFVIASIIGEANLPASSSGNNIIAYLITFSSFFILSDMLCYVGLALLATFGRVYAPKTTVADADAQILNDTLKGINDLNQKVKVNNVNSDNISLLREYKKLLDEGIITKEEFETKKKELL